MLRILIFYALISIAFCDENLELTNDMGKLLDITYNKTQKNLCPYGDGYLPYEIFNSYVGWQCYETAYKDEKRFSIYACIERIETVYQIPCLKFGNRIITFNLSNPENVDLISKTSESDDLRYQMVKCYLTVMADCESQQFSIPRPEVGFGTWVWIPNSNTKICDKDTRSKFHVAMLSISLIVGFPAVICLFYYSWTTNKIALSYHRDLLTALVFRTLFTLLIQTEVFMDMMDMSVILSKNGAACKFLASMETITSNLVWSFWVSEAYYLYKFAKDGFNKEPNVRIINYILAGVSLTFAIIWIIVMASAHDRNCWLGNRTWIQWINDPIRIVFIIVHLILIADVIRMLLTKLKAVHDDTARILRRISLYTFVLIPLFLLQFSLNAGTPEGTDCEDAYFYTLYFVDGIQCGAASLFFFYFDQQVRGLVKATLGLEKPTEGESPLGKKGNTERAITTIDSTQPVRNERPEINEENRPDVNYSSVIRPEQFQRIIHMYNRLNLTPKPSVTISGEDTFINCIPDEPDRKISLISEYYDVESLNEFHDALNQSSLSIFHDVNEFFDPDDKMLSDENFQRKLGNLPVEEIEKNGINALKNELQRTSEPKKETPRTTYQSKYLIQDSDTSSSSSESEDSVVEAPIRRKVTENRLSFQSDISSRPISESDLSVAIPIPEEVEPSEGEKTPQVFLDGLKFDFNKEEKVKNWMKENEEMRDGEKTPEVILGNLNFERNKAKTVENWIKENEEYQTSPKEDQKVPVIVITTDTIDLSVEFNDNMEEISLEEVRDELKSDKESSESDQMSDTESAEIKNVEISTLRRDSDVGHLLSASESESEEEKLPEIEEAAECEIVSLAEVVENIEEVRGKEDAKVEVSESNPEDILEISKEDELVDDGSAFRTQDATSYKQESDSDSEFEAEKVKKMIRVESFSSNSSGKSDEGSKHSEESEKKKKEEDDTDSECSSSGVNDYYSQLAAKIYSPDKIPQAKLPVNDEDLNQLPSDILKVDTDNKDLTHFMREESTEDDILIRDKDRQNINPDRPSSYFTQTDFPDLYSDLKDYPSRRSPNILAEKRQSYTDMFSKYKSKLLTEKNKTKSLQEIINKDDHNKDDTNGKSMRTVASADAIVDPDSSSTLKKGKNFTDLNAQLNNENSGNIPVFESDNSSDSSDDNKKSHVPRQINPGDNDDWEPQKVFY